MNIRSELVSSNGHRSVIVRLVLYPFRDLTDPGCHRTSLSGPSELFLLGSIMCIEGSLYTQ